MKMPTDTIFSMTNDDIKMEKDDDR